VFVLRRRILGSTGVAHGRAGADSGLITRCFVAEHIGAVYDHRSESDCAECGLAIAKVHFQRDAIGGHHARER
jgi:hypothetical protein